MPANVYEPGVYIVYDYRDGIPRYVGQTGRNPMARLSEHLLYAKYAIKDRTDKPFYQWLREIGRENARLEFVERVDERSERIRAEEWWIMYFLGKGMPLYNIDGRKPRWDGRPRGVFFP